MRSLAYMALLAGVTIIVVSVLVVLRMEEAEAPPESGTGPTETGQAEACGPSLYGVPVQVDASGQLASSPETFDVVARTLFANVYRLLARQIYGDYGVSQGVCIDVGAGPAYLSIELAKITNLEFYALDIDPRAMPIAIKNVQNAGLLPRFSFVVADAQNMPFKDNFADIIISRGSYLFWEDKVAGFREIYRVLRPGGIGYIGGGMGRLMPTEELLKIKKEMNRLKYGPTHWGYTAPSVPQMRQILEQAGVPANKYVILDESGREHACACAMWVEIKK